MSTTELRGANAKIQASQSLNSSPELENSKPMSPASQWSGSAFHISPPTKPSRSMIPNPTPVNVPNRRRGHVAELLSRFTAIDAANRSKATQAIRPKPPRKGQFGGSGRFSGESKGGSSFFSKLSFGSSSSGLASRPKISKPILPEDTAEVFASRLRPPTLRPDSSTNSKQRGKASDQAVVASGTATVSGPQHQSMYLNNASTATFQTVSTEGAHFPSHTAARAASRLNHREHGSGSVTTLKSTSNKSATHVPYSKPLPQSPPRNTKEAVGDLGAQEGRSTPRATRALQKARAPPSGRSSALGRTSALKGRTTPGGRKVAQSYGRVQELKEKVTELERVLQRSRSERESVAEQSVRIYQLEAQLEEERAMRRQLEEEFQRVTSDPSYSRPNTVITTVPSVVVARPINGVDGSWDHIAEIPASSRVSTLLRGDSRRSVNPLVIDSQRNSVLSHTSSENYSSSISQSPLFRLSSASTSPTLSCSTATFASSNRKSAVERSRMSTDSLNQQQQQQIQSLTQHRVTLTARVAMLENDTTVLEKEKTRLCAELEARGQDLAAATAQITELEAVRNAMEADSAATLADMTEKYNHAETGRLKIHKKLESLHEALDTAKASKSTCERQIMALTVSQRTLKQQLTLSQRESRKSKKAITDLETTVTDLKLTIEEKILENDELNCSVSRIMQEASSFLDSSTSPMRAHTGPVEVQVGDFM